MTRMFVVADLIVAAPPWPCGVVVLFGVVDWEGEIDDETDVDGEEEIVDENDIDWEVVDEDVIGCADVEFESLLHALKWSRSSLQLSHRHVQFFESPAGAQPTPLDFEHPWGEVVSFL